MSKKIKKSNKKSNKGDNKELIDKELIDKAFTYKKDEQTFKMVLSLGKGIGLFIILSLVLWGGYDILTLIIDKKLSTSYFLISCLTFIFIVVLQLIFGTKGVLSININFPNNGNFFKMKHNNKK